MSYENRKRTLGFETMLWRVSHGNFSHLNNFILDYIYIFIFRKRTMGFETMLWRVSHGNVFVKFADIDQVIEDPKTGDMLDKAVFIVFYQVPILET